MITDSPQASAVSSLAGDADAAPVHPATITLSRWPRQWLTRTTFWRAFTRTSTQLRSKCSAASRDSRQMLHRGHPGVAVTQSVRDGNLQEGKYNHMKREQAVLRSWIVVIALMFTTTAFAQVQCKAATSWSYDDPNRTESVSDINRIMKRFLTWVELVPPQEADYIRKELAKQQNEKFDLVGLKKLQGRRYYTTIRLRDAVAVMMQQAEAAERVTARRDVASHLIEVLYTDDVTSVAQQNVDEYAKRVPYVEGAFNPAGMLMEARFVAAAVLQCIVKGL
jgi:hypothetical protein